MTREIHEMQWAVFCRVIDNHGDIGFCWRLATQLAADGDHVNLYVDDTSALAWMAPHGNPKVAVKAWPLAHDEVPVECLPQVVIEAFGCELPHTWQAAMAAAVRTPVWVNLEYFSAETYASHNHGLPSPVMSGPAKGLTKWFFYPGLDEPSGGLLSGPMQIAPHCTASTAVSDRWRISVFCYEPVGMALWLRQLSRLETKVELCVTAGRATQAVELALRTLPIHTAKLLKVNYLAHMSQDDYDVLLSSMDLNLVRGEDSLVRAMHAGKPFLWQIYPQHDGAHWPKLHAFLQRTQAPDVVLQAHLAWNSDTPETMPELTPKAWAQWANWAQVIQTKLALQTGLVERLRDFVVAKG